MWMTLASDSMSNPIQVDVDAAKPQISVRNQLSTHPVGSIAAEGARSSSGGGVATRQRREVIMRPTVDRPTDLARCRMNPLRPEQHQRLVALVKSANTVVNTPAPRWSTPVHLVTYSVSFPEYLVNPLPGHNDTFFVDDDNLTAVYKPCCWTRVLSDHGRLVLTGGLPFNRNALSMTLLDSGVQSLGDVALVDVPQGCMGRRTMDAGARMSAVIDLLTRDLDAENPWSRKPSFQPDINLVCHQIIARKADNSNSSRSSEFRDDENVDNETSKKVARFSYRLVNTPTSQCVVCRW